MNRRDFLGLAGGIAISGFSANLLKSENELKNIDLFIKNVGIFNEEIDKIASSKSEYELNLIKNRANQKTKSGENFIDYSINFYNNNQFIDERKSIKKIPEDIKNKLADLIPGLISQESKFLVEVSNKSGATGSTQVLSNNSIFKKGILLSQFPLQVRESFRMFETIWSTLDNKVDFKAFADKYGLSDNELNNFIVLCMINSYNTGQSRMAGILNKFENSISREQADMRIDKTSEGLFNLITNLAYNFKWDNGYRKRSFFYTKGCLAYAKVLGTGEINSSIFDSHKIIGRNISSKTKEILEKNDPTNILASASIGGASISAIKNLHANEKIVDNISNTSKGIVSGVRKSVFGLLGLSNINRREFLRNGGLLILGAIAGNNINNKIDLKDIGGDLFD